MMKKMPKKLALSLGLAFSLDSAACAHQIQENRILIDSLRIRDCSKLMENGIEVNFSRFGSVNHLPKCDDEVKMVAFNGVSSDAKTWALLAWELPKKEREELIAVDLSGRSLIDGLKLQEGEINPLSIAERLEPFLDNIFEDIVSPIILTHSAGGAVGGFSGDKIKDSNGKVKDSKIIMYNPVLGATSRDVYLPSRTAPYACKLQQAPEILRRGAVAPKNGPIAPDLVALGKSQVTELASSTNVCLSVVGNDGRLVSEPCEQTPIKRLRRDMDEYCEGAKAYTNSVRKPGKLKEWNGKYKEVIARNSKRITVILSTEDGVLNSKRTEDLIKREYPEINIIKTKGGHEASISKPKNSSQALHTAINGGSYEGKMLAER